MLSFFLLAALADVPDTVRPALAPIDAPVQYAAWLEASGGGAHSLACDPFWPQAALLCYRVIDGDRRRFVTTTDLRHWGVDQAGLRTEITLRAAAALADQTPRETRTEDLPGAYWEIATGDGWAVAGLLHPASLGRKLGAPAYLVAAPVDDVLLLWKPGSAELDKVMAVAATRIYTDQPGGVTPVVHRFTGSGWLAFAEAVPKP